MRTRSYLELGKLHTFRERFDYLKLKGEVGEATFGSERYLNQRFYTSPEWKRIRNYVIDRDDGCDLGILGREIHGRLIVHHMNPMIPQDILEHNDSILNIDHLICVSHRTHNAIHYGSEPLWETSFPVRKPGDTILW